MNEHDADDHFGPDCPECRAASEACRVMGGFAESLEKMLADGTIERLGYEMAQRREQAYIDALFGKGNS